MPRIRGQSGWTFKTSAGAGVSVLFVTAGKGHLVLKDPKGAEFVFNYAAAGVSASKGGVVTITGSTEDMTSVGTMFVLDTFHGSDLTSNDIEGLCVILEVSAGMGKGNTGTVMFLGIPLGSTVAKAAAKHWLVQTLLGPAVGPAYRAYKAIKGLFSSNVPAIDPLELANHAKALLLMDGFNTTVGVSAGVSGSYGYLWTGVVSPWGDIKMPYPPATPTIEFKEVSMEESLITFSGDLLFDFDKWQFKDLKPGARAALLVAGYYIKWTSPRFIEIHGHTDSINRSGDANYNQRLSERRAKTVNDFLVSNRFVKPSGVEAKGYGAAMPVAPNTIRMPLGQELDNPEGRAQNRRVEIRLLDW